MAQVQKKSKRFTYNLETVLNYRTIRETQEREKFDKARRQFLEEQRKEREIKDFQQEKYVELAAQIAAGTTIDFQQIIMRRTHLETVKQQVIDQEKAREEAEQKKEEQRKELVKSAREKKILDRDKEKKRDVWKKFMNKEESKFLDEIATIKFARLKLMAK